MAAIVLHHRKKKEEQQHGNTLNLAQTRLNYLLKNGIEEDGAASTELEASTFAMQEERQDQQCWKRKEIRNFYHREGVQIFIALVILMNYLVEIARSQQRPDEGSSAWNAYEGLEIFFTVFFTIELAFNWWGGWFTRFFTAVNEREHYGWNMFDFTVVFVSLFALAVPSLPGITILRLFRAFRVARLFKRIDSLRRISEGILKSIPGVLQVFVFLIIMMGIWAIIGVQLFRDDVGLPFDKWTWGMYTMFKCLMGDFIGLNDELLFEHDKPLSSVVFFASYVFLATILLMNVVVAVLLDSYLDYGEEQDARDSGADKIEDALRTDLPTLYMHMSGNFTPIRSIDWDEIEYYKKRIYEVTPTGSDAEEQANLPDDEFLEDINTWDVEKVGRFLIMKGFEHHVKKFTQNNINGECLARLSSTELCCLGMPYALQDDFDEAVQPYLIHKALKRRRAAIIESVFNEYDTNGSGTLDRKEFVTAWMRVLPEGEEIFNEKVVGEFFDAIDLDKRGQIDLEEFKKAQGMFEKKATSVEEARSDSMMILAEKMGATDDSDIESLEDKNDTPLGMEGATSMKYAE